MPRNNKRQIAVSGSLAYDRIMNFPGRFQDHILPGKIHSLSLSFTLDRERLSFGGTAGNIAYNLALLGEKPTILSVVGSDFLPYKRHLLQAGCNLKHLREDRLGLTAAAYVITDSQDNQLAAFRPGPVFAGYAKQAVVSLKQASLAIVAAEAKGVMLEYCRLYQKERWPFIFDPGQALPLFSAGELLQAIRGAKVLIGNDYEIALIGKVLGLNQKELARLVDILVITKGAKGSELIQGREKVRVEAAKPKNASDPTGAGDAYRAGLIKGMLSGYNLRTCGRLAGLVAAYTVERFGTQTHHFSPSQLEKRYYSNFREKIKIS